VLRGLLQFFSALTLFGAGLLIILWMRGELDRRGYRLMYLGLLFAVLVQLSTGLVSTLAFLLLAVFLFVWVGRGSINLTWTLAIALTLLLLVGFRSVILQYRSAVWFNEQSFSIPQRTAIMLGLFTESVQTQGLQATLLSGGEAMSKRSGILDILADVVRRTPAEVPYWNGSTYFSLIGKAVPRILWPNKPTMELGQDFGHRYQYLDQADASTSINFPYLVEFYANFGPMAILPGMLVVGMIYGLLATLVNRPGQSTLASVAGVVLLLPLFNIESDFAVTFGGLLLNGAALWLILITVQRESLATHGSAARRIAGTARTRRNWPANPHHRQA
jgi:hypothetical protein